MPTIHEPIDVDALWNCANQFDLALITHPAEQATNLNKLIVPLLFGSRLLVCIGAEGGWTDEEVAAATALGFHSARLGPAVLRIETAAIAACAAVCLMS